MEGSVTYKRKEVIGDCTLYLGDCMEVLSVINGVDAILSDPPYGISWKRGSNKARSSKSHKGIENDDDVSARDDLLSCFPDKMAAVFGSFYKPFPLNTKQVLVWHKPADSGLVGSVTGFRRDAEPIFLVGPWPNRIVEQSSVLRTMKGQSSTVTETGHPHTKPVDLMKTLAGFIPKGYVIFDPFMGSGTTGVACCQLGRPFIGVEIDEGYFDIAVKRIREAQRSPDMFFTPTPKAEQVPLDF